MQLAKGRDPIRYFPEIGFVPSGPSRARVQPQNGFVPSTEITRFSDVVRRRRIGNSPEIGFVFGGQTAPSRGALWARLGSNLSCLQVFAEEAGCQELASFLPGHIVLPKARHGQRAASRSSFRGPTVREGVTRLLTRAPDLVRVTPQIGFVLASAELC